MSKQSQMQIERPTERLEALAAAADILLEGIKTSDLDVKEGFSDYMELRGLFKSAAAVAEETGETQQVYQLWAQSQRQYADVIMQAVSSGRSDLDNKIQTLRERQSDLRSDYLKFEDLSRRGTSAKELSEVMENAVEFENVSEELVTIETRLTSINIISEDMKTLKSLEDHDIVNYALPDAEAVIDQFVQGEYTGPVFEHFTDQSHNIFGLEDRTKIQRSSDLGIEEGELTPRLKGLLQLKAFVEQMPNSTQYTPAKIKSRIEEQTGEEYIFSSNGISSILRANGELFGVTYSQKVGYSFERDPSVAPKADSYFIANLSLPQKERNPFNKEMVQIALARLLESNPQAYDEGFHSEDLVKAAQGLPINERTTRTNLTRGATEHYGLMVLDDSNPKNIKYGVQEPQPFQKHVDFVLLAVETHGHGRFTAEDLSSRVAEEGDNPYHSRMYGKVLDLHHEKFGLKVLKGNPTKYQRIDSPASAEKAAASPTGLV